MMYGMVITNDMFHMEERLLYGSLPSTNSQFSDACSLKTTGGNHLETKIFIYS